MKVWVDCTAAAHPLVLRPIIERLRSGGHQVFVTTRSYGQTLGVLDRLGIPYEAVGTHGGASRAGKARALASRSRRLAGIAWERRPDLALAHGSVDLAVVSAGFRIPSVQMQDYEFAGLQRQAAFRAARRVMVPDSIPVERLARVGAPERKLFRFPGLKEEYYLADFEPDPTVVGALGIDPADVLVVVRPPPETSEYHAPSDLHRRLLDRLAAAEGTISVVIPRTGDQAETVRSIGSPRLLVPEAAIDAQSLIAYADLVVSAGGTMNREAVALGTPAYTTFAGRMGGVDERLIAEGRLLVLDDPQELALEKRRATGAERVRRDPDLLVQGVLGAVG